jgi:hypothetical protein
LTAFDEVERTVPNGRDLATVKPAAHLNLFEASIACSDKGATIAGASVNTDQVEIPQANCVVKCGGLRDRGRR